VFLYSFSPRKKFNLAEKEGINGSSKAESVLRVYVKTAKTTVDLPDVLFFFSHGADDYIYLLHARPNSIAI